MDEDFDDKPPATPGGSTPVQDEPEYQGSPMSEEGEVISENGSMAKQTENDEENIGNDDEVQSEFQEGNGQIDSIDNKESSPVGSPYNSGSGSPSSPVGSPMSEAEQSEATNEQRDMAIDDTQEPNENVNSSSPVGSGRSGSPVKEIDDNTFNSNMDSNMVEESNPTSPTDETSEGQREHATESPAASPVSQAVEEQNTDQTDTAFGNVGQDEKPADEENPQDELAKLHMELENLARLNSASSNTVSNPFIHNMDITDSNKERSPSRSPNTENSDAMQEKSKDQVPDRSRSGTPDSRNSRSRSGSPHSRSGSPRSRSGSAQSGSGSARSRSGSAHSRSGSPGSVRSRSGSPGSRRSRSGTPGSQRSRSGSAGSRRSGTGSGSPGSRRSASGSPASRRSGSGSPASRRSRSGSAGSRSGSPGSRRSGSGSRNSSPGSRGGSPRRSRSGSPAGSAKSGSASPRGSTRSRASSPAGSTREGDSDKEEEAQATKTKRKGSDDESDKESAVGELIADIFGSSDEDEEFEGFGAADVQVPTKKTKKKSALVSDEDSDSDAEAPDVGVEAKTGAEAAEPVLPDLSSDSEDEAVAKRENTEEFVSDFDLMMARKKEEQGKRRKKKKDIDIINDNDDLISDLIQRMKQAAEEDRGLNQQRKPAIKKLSFLPYVQRQLNKVDLQEAFLECGILSAITEWLAPLPDKNLPHLKIREALLKQLLSFPPMGGESLKSSGIGKAVMYIYKHPKEVRSNRELAGKIINEWSRPIFSLTSNYKTLTKEEREERDYANLPKRRRISAEGGMTPRRDIDKALRGEEKAPRPGEKGWVMRARVPQPSHKDYVVRPKSNIEETVPRASKKTLTRYEKKMRELAERKKNKKQQRAITISIEGRGMAL